MKVLSIFVVLAIFISTQGLLFPAAYDVTQCIQNLSQIRDNYKRADAYQRGVFSKVVLDDLKRAHPLVSESVIQIFISTKMFNDQLTDEQICNSYNVLFGPNKLGLEEKNDRFPCLYNCLSSKYSLEDILRIATVCSKKEDPVACVIAEVGGTFSECVSNCFSKKNAKMSNEKSDDCEKKVSTIRAHFKSIENVDDKKAFLKKLFDKIVEKLPSHNKVVAGDVVKKLFFSDFSDEKVCKLTKKVFDEKEAEDVKSSSSTSECTQKIENVRSHYKGLPVEEKKEFLKKASEKLNEKYPNSEKKVQVFLGFAVSEVKGEVVCKLYKRFFKSENPVDLSNPLQCFYDCMAKFLTPEKLLKIMNTCQTDVTCYLNELQGPALDCAAECFNGKQPVKLDEEPSCPEKVEKVRTYYKGLEREEKKEFIIKLYKKLTDKYKNVDRKQVGAFIAALLFQRGTAESVCELYKSIFKTEGKAVESNDDNIETKVEDKPVCVQKVEKVREYFNSLDKDGKKEFIVKIYKKMTETYSTVDGRKVGAFIAALLFDRVAAEKVCELYKKIFRSEDAGVASSISQKVDENVETKVDEPSCAAKVEQAREHFNSLDKDGKKEFLVKLFKKLIDTYPNVDKKRVGAFVAALLFDKLSVEKVCEMYKKIFKPEVQTKVDDEPTCPEKVEQLRVKFNSLDRDGKKELVVKIYKKLTEKYPEVDRKKVGAFIAALLFQRVPAEKVCEMFNKIFKGEGKVETSNDDNLEGNVVTSNDDNIEGKVETSNDDDIETKVEDKPTCAVKVEKVREYFNSLDKDGKKEFIVKLYKKLTNTYPNVDKKEVGSFIATLLFKRANVETVCEMYKKVFKPEVETKVDDEPSCTEKVEKARALFNSLDKDGKKEFLVKLFKKLIDTYPNVDKKRVGAFVAALLFDKFSAEKVCEMYKKIFKPEVQTKVDDEPSCSEKVEKLREKFKSLDKDGKKELFAKLYKKLNETYPNVDRKKVGAFVVALLFDRVPAEKVCELYKKIFKSEDAGVASSISQKVDENVETKVENKPTCVQKVEKAREYFNSLEKDGKKEFLIKVYEKLTKKYSKVDESKVGAFIAALLFERSLAENVCELYKKTFERNEVKTVEETPICEEKLERARTHFKSLDKDGKKEFVDNLNTKLIAKYPNVERRKVAVFIGALFYDGAPADYVCKLYKQIFQSTEVVQQEITPEKFKCLVKCASENLTKEEFLSIYQKCKKDRKCYISEFTSRAKGCAQSCLLF